MVDQTLGDVTGSWPLNGAKTKTLSVKITATHLLVKSLDKVLVDDDLYAAIKPDESTWTVSDGILEVSFEKIKKEWWPHVLVSDPKVNVREIEPEKAKLSDLDPETAANVEKMMYDQRQKNLGLPTSEEQKKMKMLENFKKQHPELDFSQLKDENINFQGSG